MSLKKFSKLLPTNYHYLAASCFSIFNQPKVVPGIFQEALSYLDDPDTSSILPKAQAELLLARQFREALLRAGIFGGMSKAINVMFPWLSNQDEHC